MLRRLTKEKLIRDDSFDVFLTNVIQLICRYLTSIIRLYNHKYFAATNFDRIQS